MKQKLTPGTVIVIIAAYVAVFGVLLSMDLVQVVWGLLVYIVTTILIAGYCLYSDTVSLAEGHTSFRRQSPVRRYGTVVARFHHLFVHKEQILDELTQAIQAALQVKAEAPALAHRTFVDTDRFIPHPDSRNFLVGSAQPTLRGSVVTAALYVASRSEAQLIRWWILVKGFRDPNKVATYLAFAPIALPFEFPEFVRGRLDLANSVDTTYEAFLGDVDLHFDVLCLHTIIFDTLVEVLEKHGIDTSDLKAARGGALNISISGGRTSIGNIVQGAWNVVKPPVVSEQPKE